MLDRAILLAELIDQVGSRTLGQLVGADATALATIASEIWRDIGSSGQAADAKRYAPPSVEEAHRVTGLVFHDRVKRSRPDGWSWSELAACGAPMSAACIAGVARDVFEESKQLCALNAVHSWSAAQPPGRSRRLSFVERCESSGCRYLAPRCEADEDRNHLPARFAEPPLKRLRQANNTDRGEQDPFNVGWRFQGHLQLELQIRIAIRSISKSWRSYCSGWHAWHEFMSVYHPYEHHFPITLPRVAAFASHFRNEASLGTYVAWIRSGQTMLGVGDGLAKRFIISLMRGIKTSWVPQPKVVLRLNMVEALVVGAVRKDLIHYAQAFVISYHFILRAQSEISQMERI